MSKLNKFIKANKSDMLSELIDVVKVEKSWLRDNLHEYSEDETPSVDIRLAIDLEDEGESGTWAFLTGLVDYDQRHSKYCSDSSIGLDTNVLTLLTELINQIED